MHDIIDTTVGEARLEWNETLDRLRAFVASRVRDPRLAEDITQDVIVRSIAAGALDRVDNPVGWLMRSAANAVIDHHRTRRDHESLDHDYAADSDGATEVEPEVRAQLARCLQPMVDRLEPIYRDAITWVDLEGRTHSDAARSAGVSTPGMKSRVQRARRQLRAMITSCCDVTTDRRGAPIDMTPRNTGCVCTK